MKQSKPFKLNQASFLPAWHFLNLSLLKVPKSYTAASLNEFV